MLFEVGPLFSAAEHQGYYKKRHNCPRSSFSCECNKSFYQRQRHDDAFDTLYENTVAQAQTLQIGEPKLPRCIGNYQSGLVVVSLTSLVNQKNSFVNNTLQPVTSLFKNF